MAIPSTVNTKVLDNDDVIPIGTTFSFTHDLTKDGAAYDLSGVGLLVKVTIRSEFRPDVVLDASLEQVAVAVAASPEDANGKTSWTLTRALSEKLKAYRDPSLKWPHLLQYVVLEGGTVPIDLDPLRIYGRAVPAVHP